MEPQHSVRRFTLLLLSTLISIALPFHAPNLIRPNIPAPRATSIHLKGQPHVDWRSFRQQLIEAEQQQENEPSIPPTPAAPPPSPPASPPQAYYGDDDWWTHELANVERGCVLLAQPGTIFPEQPLMHRAAVLVLEHSADYGTIGVLLERPTNKTLQSLLARRRDPALMPFAERPLMIGGDVLQPRRGIRVLTRRCDVPGGEEVVYGLYECTPDAAARMVTIGAAEPSDFDFYAAACQWTPEKLKKEVQSAAWVPVAASAAALMTRPAERRMQQQLEKRQLKKQRSEEAQKEDPLNPSPLEPPPPPPPAVSADRDLYFSLMEGIGGEYARQARATRSDAEVDDWLQRCATRAADMWRILAEQVALSPPTGFASAGVKATSYPGYKKRTDADGPRRTTRVSETPRSSSFDPEGPLSVESAALSVHRALHSRDNLTDVWDGMDSLAEQASYIWFTKEIDAQMAMGASSLPVKEEDEEKQKGGSNQRQNQNGNMKLSNSVKRAGRSSKNVGSMETDAASGLTMRDLLGGSSLPIGRSSSSATGGRAGGRGGGGGGGSSRLGSGAMQPTTSPTPSFSQENGLLALNLLLFEVCRFAPRERGDATSEHTSFPYIVRRAGGPASLLTLCVLYAALARRIGIALQLVTLELPPMLRGRGPDYLLRLPGSNEQAELYVDVLAEGRLRGPWDLAAFANEALGLDKKGKDVVKAQMREFVREVTPASFCLRLVEETADACEAAENLAEADFWQMQLDVLDQQIVAAMKERGVEEDHGEKSSPAAEDEMRP